MSNYTCTQCGIHKNTAGHSVCHTCLEAEIRGLAMRLKGAEAKLSELTHGIPIEKADRSQIHRCNLMGDWKFIEWCEFTEQWLTLGCYMCADDEIPSEDFIVYPLPSQTQEGSE